MAIDFPLSPVNGQVFSNWIYDSSITAWRAQGSTNNVGTQIAQLQTASPITVASQAARDALYPTPVQGQSVFRTDLGYQQTYYGAWNATTNPGGRGTVAAWYNNQRNMGLVPIVPPTVNVSGGTATANTLGRVSFSAVSSISLNNVFSALYTNYRFLLNITGSSVQSQPSNFRLRSSGTDLTAASYQWMVANIQFNNLRMLGSSGVTTAEIGFTGTGDNSFFAVTDIANPFTTDKTYATTSRTYNNEHSTGAFWINNNNSYDGFTVYPQNGNFTGSITVYGYNI